MTDHLFVYGTLKRGSGEAMSKWLAQHSQFIGEATFNGRLYRVAAYPGLVASSDPAERVHGEVVRLRNAAEMLAELDRYEACGDGFAAPTEYVRSKAEVTLADGGTVETWVYLYNWPVKESGRIASGRFSGDPR